jgi:hypothetical protein
MSFLDRIVMASMVQEMVYLRKTLWKYIDVTYCRFLSCQKQNSTMA